MDPSFVSNYSAYETASVLRRRAGRNLEALGSLISRFESYKEQGEEDPRLERGGVLSLPQSDSVWPVCHPSLFQRRIRTTEPTMVS